jgi:hypothetical protein
LVTSMYAVAVDSLNSPLINNGTEGYKPADSSEQSVRRKKCLTKVT